MERASATDLAGVELTRQRAVCVWAPLKSQSLVVWVAAFATRQRLSRTMARLVEEVYWGIEWHWHRRWQWQRHRRRRVARDLRGSVSYPILVSIKSIAVRIFNLEVVYQWRRSSVNPLLLYLIKAVL